MKSLYLRSVVAIACAASLAACGGDKGNLALGGSVIGLFKPGLVLVNGNSKAPVAAGATAFTFPDLIGSDTSYDVTIGTPPTGASCKVIDGKGKSSDFNVTTVQVQCSTNQYELGGTIAGLDRKGLVLLNGADALPLDANTKQFTFGRKVDDGASYGVTISQSPVGLHCSFAPNTNVGTMGSAPVNTIQVVCLQLPG